MPFPVDSSFGGKFLLWRTNCKETGDHSPLTESGLTRHRFQVHVVQDVLDDTDVTDEMVRVRGMGGTGGTGGTWRRQKGMRG